MSQQQHNYSKQNAYSQQIPPGVTIHYQGDQQPYFDEQYVQEDQFVPQGYVQQGSYYQNGGLPQQQTQSWNQQYPPQGYQQNQHVQSQQNNQHQQGQFQQNPPHRQYQQVQPQFQQDQYEQYQSELTEQDQYNQSQKQRTRSVGPEKNYSYFVDKKGNYIPSSDPPMYTTGEPDGANYVPYSSVPRRARSVDPNGENEDDLRFKFGGMAFVDSESAFYEVEGNDVFVDLNTKHDDPQVRRPGDNYGLDFNESTYRGDQVEIEEGYQGYQAQKPRKHWTYAEDPFNPNNAYVDDLLAYYDPTDVVGDTIANHRVTVERELTEEERNNFCTEYIPTPGFLPQHRTEKPEPKEDGPICYSLSAKKELAREGDYRPPSRSQSAGPAQQTQKKEVNLRNLLDDSAIQRQENVIQPAPWAPDSDYKQGRWQNQSGQLDPLNSRPQIPNQRPEWSQQVENKKNAWAGKSQGANQTVEQPNAQRPAFSSNKTGQSQNQRQGSTAQANNNDEYVEQSGLIPTGNQVNANYTYYQQGQQTPQKGYQKPLQQQNTSFTIQQPGQAGQRQQIQAVNQQGQRHPQSQVQQPHPEQQRGRPQLQQRTPQQAAPPPQQQGQRQLQQPQKQAPQQPQALAKSVISQQPQRPGQLNAQQQQSQQRTLSQPPQNRPAPAGSYQRTITYVNGKPVGYEEISDRHQTQQQPQNYNSVVYVNGQPAQKNSQDQGQYTQNKTTYYSQSQQQPQNVGLTQQAVGPAQGQNFVQPQFGQPGAPRIQAQPVGWNEFVPKGQLSNTQVNANGQYRGAQGQNIQYQRQVTTAANPQQQYQLVKQTETQVRQQYQPTGNLSRQVIHPVRQ